MGFAKICPDVRGFRGNLDTKIIKNAPDWFRNSLNVRNVTIVKPFTAESPSGELQSVKAGRLK